MKSTRRSLLAASLAATALSRSAFGQASTDAGDYPNRPIRIVLGFPPGGGMDGFARPTYRRLGEKLGVQCVIDNRGGNNGNIAMDHVAKSPPDGYTLFYGNIGNFTTQVLFPNVSFDTVRDFVFVCQVTLGPLVFAVPADFPVKTLKELADLAKAKPGQLNFGSSGTGGLSQFAFEVWKRDAGKLDVVHVPYRGTGPALQDLLAGRVQMMLDGYGAMRSLHEAGRLRVLAVTSKNRHPLLSDVPTAEEAGLPGFEFVSWTALAAPAGTPPAIVAKLEEAMKWTMENTDVPQAILNLGTFPAFEPGSKVRDRLVADRKLWTQIAQEAKISVD